MKIACGLVTATAGTAQIAGAPAGSPEAHRALGYLAELFRFPDWLSADELLGMHQRLAGLRRRRRRARAAARRRRAAPRRRTRRVGAMSKGMQQRLGIAQAMVGGPRLLLLDEPTSALDPAGRRTVRRLLEDLRGDGVAVLLNSHLLSEVELVCDRVAIIARGELVAGGHAERAQSRRRGGGRDRQREARTSRTPRATMPRGIVRDLVAAGEDVYDVRVLRSSLEDSYLEAVGES